MFSHKLGRPVTLFSADQVALWTFLEAQPCVKRFCEFPARLAVEKGKSVLADFWVSTTRRECFLVIGDIHDPNCARFVSPRAPVKFFNPRRVSTHATWIMNWRSMLPYVVAQRCWLGSADLDRVVSCCTALTRLGDLEHHLVPVFDDPTVARAAVFTALVCGRLRAPALRKELWSFNTLIAPLVNAH